MVLSNILGLIFMAFVIVMINRWRARIAQHYKEKS